MLNQSRPDLGIPNRINLTTSRASANPEPRDSEFDASHRPGMTNNDITCRFLRSLVELRRDMLLPFANASRLSQAMTALQLRTRPRLLAAQFARVVRQPL